jgi:DNA polymerase/3'-5' exonuclease PolX
MLANGQIKVVAQEVGRTAAERIRSAGDAQDRVHLWEVVRYASRAIEAVVEMEMEDLSASDQCRRARYLVSELECALEAARKAKVVLDWTAQRQRDAL